MISVIWPYWDRQAVADFSASWMAKLYQDLDLEIVVVDDGNKIPYQRPDIDINIKVVRIPEKDIPLNPCLPINLGVENATGDIIVLTNPEIIHKSNILGEMQKHLTDVNKYIQASVFHVKQNGQRVWHSHSSVSGKVESGIPMPKNACFHFLSMLHKDLFYKAGGFDNDYREGAGYDDPDFVLRLNRAGAEFVMLDDVEAEHYRTGAHAVRSMDDFTKNEQIFVAKWAK